MGLKNRIRTALTKLFGEDMNKAALARVIEALPAHLEVHHEDLFRAFYNLGEAEKMVIVPENNKRWDRVEEQSVLTQEGRWFYRQGDRTFRLNLFYSHEDRTGKMSDADCARDHLYQSVVCPYSEESAQNALAALERHFPDVAPAAKAERQQLLDEVRANREKEEREKRKEEEEAGSRSSRRS